MAKFKPSLTDKISGTIGATKFLNTPIGPVVTINTIPINTWSPSKQQSQINFKKAFNHWDKLSPAQVKKWCALAKTVMRVDKAENIVPSRGRDLFNKLNRQLIEINEPVIYDAPKKIFPKHLKKLEVELSGNTTIEDIIIHFSGAFPANTKFIVYATHGLKNGINFIKPSWYRRIAVINLHFKSGTSILNEYIKVFQYVAPQYTRMSFMFRPVSSVSGFSSEPYEFLSIK